MYAASLQQFHHSIHFTVGVSSTLVITIHRHLRCEDRHRHSSAQSQMPILTFSQAHDIYLGRLFSMDFV
jgi:hypothetical protein